MFYAFRVNKALFDLGIDPSRLSDELRVLSQSAGERSGYSPQEVAVVLASKLPLAFHFNLNKSPVRAWIRERKCNPKDPVVKTALGDLAWWDMMEL